ncbi:MAG: translational GTPase TypA, partial [Actinobacteria bacterium]|nr:translational GTPase TypA [Actinomycetota bacterium]
IVYCSARAGTATFNLDEPGTDLQPLFKTLVETVSPPAADVSKPLQALVTNLASDSYVGRLARCRVVNGTIKRNQQIAWCKADGNIVRAKVGVIYMTESHERLEVESADAGEIIEVSGIEEVNIGDTLADIENPVPLPVITVDEPSLSMTIGINTSPLNGKDGSKLTARQIKARLDSELVGNVSLRVLNTDRPDAWEVQARGELQLAILIEQMRREGFELTVGKPQVVTKEIDGVLHEPVERLTIDVPEEHLGAVTSLVAPRKARLENMSNHGTGWVRLDYLVPARGLIGFRTEFLTETRGTGIMHHVAEGYEPWAGEMRARERGSIVADRRGMTTAYAITSLQERAVLFVPPGVEVYEGMVVGENSRTEDMDVNIVREKKLTNMRASGSDHTQSLVPPRLLSLEQALEFIEADECVEVTPSTVRLRKVQLNATERAKTLKQSKAARG